MYAHTWKDLEINQVQTPSQIKQDDCPKETQKKCPIKVILPITSVPLFFWACPCYYLHVIIFPPTKHFVSLLSICLYKFIYTKSEVQGLVTGYWPLRPGAWDSELSMPQPDFNLCPGNQNPSLSCCRLSRLRSKGSLLHTMNNFTFRKSNNF